MITNKAIQKKPEHKQVMQLQSWYEPALRTLDGLLEIRRAVYMQFISKVKE